MARVSLTDLYQVPDILSGEAWYFLITNIPGSNGNTRNLALKCVNSTLAGGTNEKMTVPLHGHQINFTGRSIQGQSLPITYYEDSTMDTWRNLRAWEQYVKGRRSGNSAGYKRDYSVNGILEIYDTTGKMINSTKYYHLFPQEIPDTTFDGTSSTAIQIQCTFSYDYSEDSIVALR